MSPQRLLLAACLALRASAVLTDQQQEHARPECGAPPGAEGEQKLKVKLQSADMAEQLDTIRCLGDHGESHGWATEELIAISKNSAKIRRVRAQAAVSSVRLLANDVKSLLYTWPNEAHGQQAPDDLSTKGNDAQDEIRRLLNFSDWGVRRGAAQGLGSMGKDAQWGIRYLQELFSDKNSMVRIQASNAVAKISVSTGDVGKSAASFLMGHAIPEVRVGCAMGLGELGRQSEDFISRLKDAVSKPLELEQVQVASAKAAARIATLVCHERSDTCGEAHTSVQDLLKQDSPRIQNATLQSLADLGAEAYSMLDVLRRLYEDPDARPEFIVAAAAAAAEITASSWASTNVAGKSTESDVEKLLEHQDPKVQLGAARGVGNLGQKKGVRMIKFVRKLRRLFNHRDAGVCIEAAGASAKILAMSGEAGKAATELLLDHSYAEVREGAVRGLGDLGANAHWILPELRLDADFPQVQFQTARAKAKIAAASRDKDNITSVLYHELSELQIAGIQGVGEQGDLGEWVVQDLNLIMNRGVDPRRTAVRVEAASACAKIAGTTGNMDTVTDLLYREEPLRWGAAEGLAEIGIDLAAWVPRTLESDLRLLFEDKAGMMYSTSRAARNIFEKASSIVEVLKENAPEQHSEQS